MRHIQTGHVPYYSRGLYKRWKWGNATGVSSQRLRRDEHLYVTETAKTAWCSGRTSIRHESRPQWPRNGPCKRQSKNGVHGSVYGALITGSRSGDASRDYAGLRLGFGLPWFQFRNPGVDCQSGRLLALQTPGGAEVVAVNRVEHQECPGNVPGSTTGEEACSEGGGGIPDIQILGATAFDDQLASEQVVGTFFLIVGDCTGLLGTTVEDITDGE